MPAPLPTSLLLRALTAGVAVSALAACSLQNAKVATPPPAPAAAHKGGVLRVGITTPGGIDPLNAYEPAGKLVSSTMCDTLLSLDPVTGQLREALAKGWVVTNDGGITLKTRKGLRFNDGSKFSAKDVNFSLQQLVAPANGLYEADLARQFAAPTGNQTDVLAEPGTARDVANLISTTDLQVYNTRLRNGGAIRSFTEPAMAPISRAAYDADTTAFGAKPVCVGPYTLSKPYHSGDPEIRLVRSKHYYKGNVGYTSGGVGYPDTIVFRVYANSAAALAGYAHHEVDVVQVPTTQVGTVSDRGSLVYGAATGVEFLGLPSGTTGPLTDPDLRLALSLAVDRTKLVQEVFGPAAQPATGFEPPALAITQGTSLDNKRAKGAPLASCGSTTPAAPDLAAAQRHFAAATARMGAGKLSTLTLTVNNDAPYPQLAKAVAAQWQAALGLKVKVLTSPWRDYLAKANDSAGFTGAFRLRWASDMTAPVPTYNDQQSFLGSLLFGESTNLGNWAHWSERTFDFGMVDDAAPVTEVQQRGIAYAKLASIACKQLPLIPLAFERPAFLVRSGTIGSARPVPVGRDGVLLLRELYLK